MDNNFHIRSVRRINKAALLPCDWQTTPPFWRAGLEIDHAFVGGCDDSAVCTLSEAFGGPIVPFLSLVKRKVLLLLEHEGSERPDARVL